MRPPHEYISDKLHSNTYFSCLEVLGEFDVEDMNYFGYKNPSSILGDFIQYCVNDYNRDYGQDGSIDPKLEIKFLRAISAINKQFHHYNPE